jgi:serine/threonine-protein kinase RsbT
LAVTGTSSTQILVRLVLREESDVAQARFRVREVSTSSGLATGAVEALATATSEVARNVIVHAREGEILIGTINDGRRAGIVVIARDCGPGIPNIEEAMLDGFSTGHGLGLGLPSARRFVHAFELQSVVAVGTTVTLTMWLS